LAGAYDAGDDWIEKISFAVIDLNRVTPLIGGINMLHFIHPASVYKMYVVMEILKQVSNGDYSLYKNYVVKSPNDCGSKSEDKLGSTTLAKLEDTVTIDHLLDLMITRSDNSAANCLIDFADSINKTLHENGWYGREVTQKFLGKKLEDHGYDTVRSTVKSALYAAD
jgi:beta-lactamase class A